MSKRNVVILTVLSVFVLLSTIAVQTRVVRGQGGPSFSVTFSPAGSANVGTDVDIHIVVNASTYGASKITVSCDGVSKVETSELDYHSTWRTKGCQPGNASVLVCAKTAADEQWQQANCVSFGYTLTGSTSIPSGSFYADTGNLQPGQCTYMHWNVSGADLVKVEGNVVASSGMQQICPSVTKMYNLEATNSSGPMYMNFTVTVTTAPQTQNTGPTNQQAGGDGGQQQPSRPTVQQAQQPGTPGGVDVVVYCYAKGWGEPSSAADGSPNAAYSWKCGNTSLGDFTQVCHEVYGGDFRSVNVMDANRLGGWRCVQGGNQPVPPTQRPTLPSNCSGVLPIRLTIGQNATVTGAGDQLHLRAGDGLSQPVEANMKSGDVAIVVGGPRCTDGYNWWQIQTQYGTWWAVEADGQDYWLAPGGSVPQVSVQPTAIPPTAVPQTQSQQNTPKFPDAQEKNNLGILVPVICSDWGRGGNVSEPSDAWGWKCGDGQPVDFQKACQDAWGSERPYATLADWQNKYGWKCSPNPGYVDQPNSNSSPSITGEGGMDLYQFCKSLGYQDLKLVSNDVNGWRCVGSNGRLARINLYDACNWQYKGKLPTPMYSDFNDATSWKCYANGRLPQGQNGLTQLWGLLKHYFSSDQFYELVTAIVEAHDSFSCTTEVIVYVQVAYEGMVPSSLPDPLTVANDCANAVSGIPADSIKNLINQVRSKLGLS